MEQITRKKRWERRGLYLKLNVWHCGVIGSTHRQSRGAGVGEGVIGVNRLNKKKKKQKGRLNDWALTLP